MLSVLSSIVSRLTDGPNVEYTNSAGISFTPPPLMAMFTNDGQINQLASEIGVFDDQTPLPSTYIPSSYVCISFTVNPPHRETPSSPGARHLGP